VLLLLLILVEVVIFYMCVRENEKGWSKGPTNLKGMDTIPEAKSRGKSKVPVQNLLLPVDHWD